MKKLIPLRSKPIKPGLLTFAVVPADPQNPSHLYSHDGRARPVVVAKIDHKRQVATVFPGSKTPTQWGSPIDPADYPQLTYTTYFRPQEAREVPLSDIETKDRRGYLTTDDLVQLTNWQPPNSQTA